MMHATYDPFLPEGMRWADLFDVVVVSACKPEFFGESRRPVYEIATADGFLREDHKYRLGRAYAGGNAVLVQRCFKVSGPEMLYVGDHLFTDVNMAKRGLSWRTCLILQEVRARARTLPMHPSGRGTTILASFSLSPSLPPSLPPAPPPLSPPHPATHLSHTHTLASCGV